jgi:EmrB/QacA subfamily drug resistance transporter
MPRSPLLVPLIVGCAQFMQMLDATIITTALPAMADSLGSDPIRLNLAITTYLLSLAIFIPASGWAADRFGARTVFASAIALFTVSSVLCGAAQSLPELVAARILQGAGAALMVPVGRLLVLKTVAKSDLVQAMNTLSMPAMLGPVLGPPVGGLIVTYASWRWIFLMNLPMGLIGIALVLAFIPNIREEARRPLDWPGFLLAALAMAGCVFGFESIGRGLLPDWAVLGLLLAGGLGTLLLIRHSRRASAPLVDLGLLRLPTFAAGTIGGGLFRMTIGASPFLLALLLQIVFGLSPLASGLITFTSALAAFVMRMTVHHLLRAFGFRRVLLVNGVVTVLFLCSYALFQSSTPHAVIIAVLISGGFFRSVHFSSLASLSFADVPKPAMSRANSFLQMSQQLAQSLGVGLAALTLHVSLAWNGRAQLAQSDVATAFIIVAAISLLQLLFYWRLPHTAGSELSGRSAPVEV